MTSFILPILISAIVFILAFIAGRLSKSCKNIGRFMINQNDPKKPAFWVEMDYDLDVIERQDKISFDVLFHYPPDE